MRYLFTLLNLLRHRERLCRSIKEGRYRCATVVDISVEFLVQQAVEVLILDFDGVLANHGADMPNRAVVQWLEDIMDRLPELKIYILTNKPTAARSAYFRNQFPTITMMASGRKKPYPDGIQAIIAKTQLKNLQHLMVDDRLATGILAAVMCNIQSVWITMPYQNLKAHFIVESFFGLLRKLDKLLILLTYKL